MQRNVIDFLVHVTIIDLCDGQKKEIKALRQPHKNSNHVIVAYKHLYQVEASIAQSILSKIFGPVFLFIIEAWGREDLE